MCGAPLAPDQRYCLQCGERRVPVSAFLRNSEPSTSGVRPTPPSIGPPLTAPAAAGARRNNNALTVIAGVGVLLLAMGVGVLIGRAGGQSKQIQAPAEVITVGSSAGSGAVAGAVEEPFTDDWPTGTKGYTVQLEKLPREGTTTKAVDAAKTEESSKGAGSVGALKSEDFTSLAAGSYIVYSGVYHKRSDAEKALGGLKKKFPAATVIAVSNSSKSSTGAGGGKGSGSSESHPAPPSVLESLKTSKGKSYEEKSKALPDVVSTG